MQSLSGGGTCCCEPARRCCGRESGPGSGWRCGAEAQWVACDYRQSPHRNRSVPAAGVEPAASAFSARRSHHLSYTGIGQSRRWESNLLDSRVAADRLAVRPRRHVHYQGAGGGTPTHLFRVARAVLGQSSIAGLFSSSQCWCRANLIKIQSLDPLPRAWPEEDPKPGAGLEPARALYKRGARPVELHWRFRVAGGSRTRTSPVHSRVSLPL